MEFKKTELISEHDGLRLELELVLPDQQPRAILQISHGMIEHKERYEGFMRFLAEQGYAAVIHDHRGHGASVRSEEDLGYFYTEDISAITEDLYQVSRYIKEIYPDVPLVLLGHSMGSLVARSYLKKHDDAISGLILSGPPTRNPGASFGILLARLSSMLHRDGDRHRSHTLDRLIIKAFNKGFDQKNGWLSGDSDSVDRYNSDPLCSFSFTNNGYINLLSLLKEVYDSSGWRLSSPELPILIMAGSEDPVIQSRKSFYELRDFLRSVGYKHVEARLYEGKRHELLNELGKEKIYKDIYSWTEKTVSKG